MALERQRARVHAQGTMMRKAYYEGLKSVAESVGAKAMIARAGEAFLEAPETSIGGWGRSEGAEPLLLLSAPPPKHMHARTRALAHA